MIKINEYSRRSVLKAIGTGSATAILSGVSVSMASANPIRIGVLVPISGGANDILVQMIAGVEAGINKLNKSGGIFGRKVVAVYKDSEGHPNNLQQ